MDAEYLKANVGDVLASGLTAVVLNQPEDSVDYLGRWLLKYVSNRENEIAEKEKREQLLAADKQAEEEAKVLAAAEEREQEAQAQSKKQKLQAFEDFLNGASSFDGLFEEFVSHLRNVTGSSSAYIGLRENTQDGASPDGDEEEDGQNSSQTLQYVACTEGQEFLIGQRLRSSEGVTFRVFKEEDKADDGEGEGDGEDDEDGEKKVVAAAEQPMTSVFVPNVMLGDDADKMKFWRLPDLGSYWAVRLNYEGCLNAKTLEEALEKENSIMELKAREEEEVLRRAEGEEGEGDDAEDEDDEDLDEEEKAARDEAKRAAAEAKEAELNALEAAREKETEEERIAREAAEQEAKATADELFLISHLPKENLEYAICMDSMGQGHPFSEEDQAVAERFCRLLKSTMLRIDRSLFKEERLKRQAEALIEAPPQAERSAADIAAEKEKLQAALEKSGAASTPADLQFKYRQNLLLGLKQMIYEFKTYNVFRGSLNVLLCMFYLLDYKPADVADTDGKPSWGKMRGKFGDELFNKIQAYDPRDAQMRKPGEKYATVKNLKALLKGLSYDKLKEKSYALAEIYGYAVDALAVKTKAKQERDEAKAALKAEEEARKAAEEAEKEAAGEGDEDEEDDEVH